MHMNIHTYGRTFWRPVEKGAPFKELSSGIISAAAECQAKFTGSILIDMLNNKGKTALMLASAVGNLEYVEGLLWAKAGS